MSLMCSDGQSPMMKYGGRVQLFPFPERQWPNRVLETAPVLLSTDLRDGNQSLPNPMVGAKENSRRLCADRKLDV